MSPSSSVSSCSSTSHVSSSFKSSSSSSNCSSNTRKFNNSNLTSNNQQANTGQPPTYTQQQHHQRKQTQHQKEPKSFRKYNPNPNIPLTTSSLETVDFNTGHHSKNYFNNSNLAYYSNNKQSGEQQLPFSNYKLQKNNYNTNSNNTNLKLNKSQLNMNNNYNNEGYLNEDQEMAAVVYNEKKIMYQTKCDEEFTNNPMNYTDDTIRVKFLCEIFKNI